MRRLLVEIVTERPADLLGEFVVQDIDQPTDVIADVPDVQVLAFAVTGIHHLAQVGNNIRHRLAARQRLVAQVVQPAATAVRVQELFRDGLQFRFSRANIRSHRSLTCSRSNGTALWYDSRRDTSEGRRDKHKR